MAIDATLWMPAGMDDGEKAEHAAANPDDPHGAAADAWESWASQVEANAASSETATVDQIVQSVTTGAQSVTYAQGRTITSQALERATWHRARARAYTVQVGPEHESYPDDEDGVWVLADGDGQYGVLQ